MIFKVKLLAFFMIFSINSINAENSSLDSFFEITKSMTTSNLIAGIVKIPPKQENKTYATLPGSDPIEREKMIELFTIMGSHGKVDLLLYHEKHLRKLGEEIKHVHPLKLLGCVFSTPNMKEYMDDIYHDYFKWKNFFGGYAPNMDHELMKNNLLQYTEDFALEVNIPSHRIKPFLDNRDWKGLFKFLIDY